MRLKKPSPAGPSFGGITISETPLIAKEDYPLLLSAVLRQPSVEESKVFCSDKDLGVGPKRLSGTVVGLVRPIGLRHPLPHQTQALTWSDGRKTCGFLMDMRLGKCLVALRWALSTGSKHILVVAPLSACPGWMGEIEQEGLQGHFLYGTRDKRIEILTAVGISPTAADPPMVYLVNPEGLFYTNKKTHGECEKCMGTGKEGDISNPFASGKEYWEDLLDCDECQGKGVVPVVSEKKVPKPTPIAEMPWDCVILDESPIIKNPKAQITQICQTYLTNAPHRCILSGEVAPEGPKDLFEQMKFISPTGAFMGHRKFWPWRDDVFNKLGYDLFLKKGKLSEIKKAVHARCFAMTRKQAGMGETKVFERRWCELPAKISKAYRHAERNFEVPGIKCIHNCLDVDEVGLNQISSSGETWEGMWDDTETKWTIVVYNWLSQIAGGYPNQFPQLHSSHKMKLLEELLTGELRKEQTVVSFRFNAELAAAADLLEKEGIPYGILMGSVTPEQRAVRQADFKSGKIQHILGQVKVLKYGIDLSAADTMIRYSLPLPWEEITQPMHRIMHPTKREALLYVDLLTKDTIDEDLADAAGDKKITARFFMQQIQENFKRRVQSLISQERRAGK